MQENNISSISEYNKLYKNYSNLPSEPSQCYNEEWISYGEFFGTGRIADNLREFLDYNEAKKYVHKLGLLCKNDWYKYIKDNGKIDKIAVNVHEHYSKKGTWVSWKDFLGYNSDYRSTGEIKIYNHLIQHFILCINYKNVSILKNQHLDLYLPEHKLAVEYQGIQHFKSINFFGGEKNLKETQERDQRKRDACAKHGIKLFYFSYDTSYVPKDYPYKVYSDEQELLEAINNHIKEQKEKFAS